MFDKVSESWELVKSSTAVLRQDKELLVLPLLSFLATVLVALSFLLPLKGLEGTQQAGTISAGFIFLAFCFYLSQFFVIFFFNSALVGAAMMRLRGEDPTLKDALGIAWSVVVPILGYAAIAATVGLVLRALEQKSGGLLGKLVSATLGLTWTLATFLVVPMLVARQIGPIDAIKESAVLLKKTWGHNLAGSVGIGVAGMLISMAIALVGGLLMMMAFSVAKPLGIVVSAIVLLGLLGAGIYQAALTGVYQAALYVFADTGRMPPGFEQHQLEHAFEAK